MIKGGGRFGGGGFGGGGGDGGFGHKGGNNPFDGGRDSAPDVPGGVAGRVNTQVIPGIQDRDGGSGIEKRNVVPSEGGHVAPEQVVPQEGVQAKPIPGTGMALEPVIHITVFARYPRTEGEQLVKDLGFLHAASGPDFHLVLAGYSRSKPPLSPDRLSEPKAIALTSDVTWYYDDVGFLNQVELVEQATKWSYRGGFQLLVCDVSVPGGRAAGMEQMYLKGAATLEHVIVIDVSELKESKLFDDFDKFFNALRTMIRDIRAEHRDRLTWRLSDRLALTQHGVALKVLAKAFKLEFLDAWDAARTLQNFAVRDLRKKP